MKRSPPSHCLNDLQSINDNGSLSKLGSLQSYHSTYDVKISSIVPVHMRNTLTMQSGFNGVSICTNNNTFADSKASNELVLDSYVMSYHDSSKSETIAPEDELYEAPYDDISYLSPKSKINKLRRSLDVSQMCKEFIKTAESLYLLNISSDTTSKPKPEAASSKCIKQETYKELSSKEDNVRVKSEKMIYDIMKSLKVLIADDALVDRKFLSKIVKTQKGTNIDVSTAENGCECAKLCESMLDTTVDNNNIIIFMDINMPKKNGWEATKEIRNLDKGFAPYIIGMSSFDTPEYRSSCLEAGMNTFVSKPFTIKKVQSLFNEIVLHESNRNINVDTFKPGFNDSKCLPQEILI